jgi:hypothetical protein
MTAEELASILIEKVQLPVSDQEQWSLFEVICGNELGMHVAPMSLSSLEWQ